MSKPFVIVMFDKDSGEAFEAYYHEEIQKHDGYIYLLLRDYSLVRIPEQNALLKLVKQESQFEEKVMQVLNETLNSDQNRLNIQENIALPSENKTEIKGTTGFTEVTIDKLDAVSYIAQLLSISNVYFFFEKTNGRDSVDVYLKMYFE